MDRDALKKDLKHWIVTELKLSKKPEEIGDASPLFGKDGLGIDSLDAVQLVVSAEERWGVKVPSGADSKDAQQVLASVDSLADFILATKKG